MHSNKIKIAMMRDNQGWIVDSMTDVIKKHAPNNFEFTDFPVNISFNDLLELADSQDLIYSSFWQPFCQNNHILKDNFPSDKVLIQVHHLMEFGDREYNPCTNNLLKAKHIAYYCRSCLESLCKIRYGGNLYKLNQYVDSNVFKHISPKYENKLNIGNFGMIKGLRKAAWVLENAVEDMDDVELIRTKGQLNKNDLIERFENINVYVSTSNVEGGPMGVLEAMACGIPVVITNTGFSADIIKHGINGFLISYRNSKALVDRLEWIRNNYGDAQVIGENGRKTVSKYGPKEFSEQYINLFRRIIDANNNIDTGTCLLN